jgi:cytochrome P450
MTDFVPPRPPVLPKRASLLQHLQYGLRSGIGMFLSGSYETVAVGRHPIPTMPKGEKRWLFTVRTPELIREVLVRRAADFPKSTLMDDMLRALTGYSIFISNGEAWRRHRRLMDPAFEGARIKAVFPMMLDAVDACVERIGAHADGPQGGAPMAIDVEMTHYAADVIFRTIFSEPMDAESARRFFKAFAVFQEIAYAHGMLKLARIPTRLLPGHWRAKAAAKVIRRILEAPISRRLAAVRRGDRTPKDDIMATLITTVDPETGTGFDDGELLDQIAMLFLAGHETSATAMAWSLYLLANCPHVQERAHAEAAAVFGEKRPGFEHMKRLGLTRDVFREAMRLYPPVAFLARDTVQAEQLANKVAEPGSVVFVSPWLMHRHAQHWDQPDSFVPDRFETPAGEEGLRCAYLPFSMGPRVCAGAAFALQEATLLLAELVRRFKFTPVPGHTPVPVARLTLRSENGVPLIVERR